MKVANALYETLQNAGVEVVLDDRDERAGVKFKDADLIGFRSELLSEKQYQKGLLNANYAKPMS